MLNLMKFDEGKEEKGPVWDNMSVQMKIRIEGDHLVSLPTMSPEERAVGLQ